MYNSLSSDHYLSYIDEKGEKVTKKLTSRTLGGSKAEVDLILSVRKVSQVKIYDNEECKGDALASRD